MRHRQPKLSLQDLHVIAPPGEAPSCQGTIYIAQRFRNPALPLYIERALYKLLAPLRVTRGGAGGESRDHSPVLGSSASNWQPVSVHDPAEGVGGGECVNEGEECEGGEGGEGGEKVGGGGGVEGRMEGVGDFGKNCRLQLVYGRQDEEIAAPLRARFRVWSLGFGA
jgi:hypothetical protein